tara:strand:- start:2805 stop:3335 length:531 start_codon:yes stop_codon:yes gene_type:complete
MKDVFGKIVIAIVAASLLFVFSSMVLNSSFTLGAKQVKPGDTVKVEYTGTLDDGSIFDTSEGRDPLEFKVGEGQMIPGFDTAVIGMKIGQEKEIKLEPSEAYGDPNPALIQEVPRDDIPIEEELKPGTLLAVTVPNGNQVPATITEVTDETVTIDVNHPLAGQTLNFKIKVVDIVS